MVSRWFVGRVRPFGWVVAGDRPILGNEVTFLLLDASAVVVGRCVDDHLSVSLDGTAVPRVGTWTKGFNFAAICWITRGGSTDGATVLGMEWLWISRASQDSHQESVITSSREVSSENQSWTKAPQWQFWV